MHDIKNQNFEGTHPSVGIEKTDLFDKSAFYYEKLRLSTIEVNIFISHPRSMALLNDTLIDGRLMDKSYKMLIVYWGALYLNITFLLK